MAERPSKGDSLCGLKRKHCKWAYMGLCLAHPDEAGRKIGLAIYTEQRDVPEKYCGVWWIERTDAELDPYTRISSISQTTRRPRPSAGAESHTADMFG